MLIYPVIVMVPGCVYALSRKHRYHYARLVARRSAIISSKRSGLPLKRMYKDSHGVPLENAGVYWSITHKPKYVAGVTATTPIGIDIEEILPRSCGFSCNRVANLHEWSLGKGDPVRLFFRYWTAKEAVLKAERTGLVGLSRCFVKQIVDKTSMIVNYGLNKWYVEHLYFGSHVAAIATKINNVRKVKWLLLEK